MIGRILGGKYRVLEQVGAGGMAEVYKAEQLGVSHRTVAIKVLKEEHTRDASFLRRFETEAHAVLVLSHENVVRSYDVGQEGDMPYIVLEYVEGSTLKQNIREQGVIPPRMAVNIGLQVLDALAHAHEKGIIHRDVKPQNIIISKKNRAKLADFGIARLSADTETMTYASGGMLGSVHYFSPEQAKGRPATAESDIYSMGVTLYEMLTGMVPFTGESSVAIALKHLQEEIVPPIVRNPEISPALNDIVVRAMQKKPSMRYHSAKDMRRDLMRALREPDGDFAKVFEESEPAPKKRKRNRRISVRIMLVTALVVALFTSVLLLGQSILQAVRGGGNAARVPMLVGKTLEEAEELANLRGYTIEVTESVTNEDMDSGHILTQLPEAGLDAPGGVIRVTVSVGSGEITYVPDIIGKTLAEASALLDETGLLPGAVDYRESEYPSGQVFKQDPQPETEMLRGDEVNMVVSGVPTRNLEAPDVLEQDMETAFRLFAERGYERFLVRRGEIHEAAGIVVKQNPAKGEFGSPASAVVLTVTIAEPLRFRMDVPITMDVVQDETRLLITEAHTAGDIPYELIMHEQTLSKGRQEFTLDIPCEESGAHELIVYVNDIETLRLPVSAIGLVYEGGEE